jgi:hypothetical protein
MDALKQACAGLIPSIVSSLTGGKWDINMGRMSAIHSAVSA